MRCNCFIGNIIMDLLIIFSTIAIVNSEKLVNGTCPSSKKTQCVDGILLPKWEPSDGLSVGDKTARAIVYFACLLYLFLGVSIIADRFMAAIEVITSQEKEITIKKKNGESQVITVRIWNETVSNLTLMSLGSSAPEILLSIIEICGKNFESGDLGPGTIVGSAAFNLFVIIGVCIIVIPNPEIRRIKHLSVFFITSSWSVFAYLWLYLIIAVSSPGVVLVWEAVLTFAFFPIIVVLAYIADTKIFFKKFLKKKYSPRGKIESSKGEIANNTEEVAYEAVDDDLSEFDKNRLEYIEAIKEMRKKYPNKDTKEWEELAQVEVLSKAHKSRAYYRMQATRQLTGSGNVIKRTKIERRISFDEGKLPTVDYPPNVQRFFFNPGHYTVMENIGKFTVTVSRIGGDMDAIVSVDYETVDGTARAGEDYVAAHGVLQFNAGESHKQILVEIIDDEVYEEDEHFTIQLSNPKVITAPTNIEAKLVDPFCATIMVLDDDHSGVFHFELATVEIAESIKFAKLKVTRDSGCRGVVRVPYRTFEGTAKGKGKDFEDVSDFLEFQNDQTQEFIKIRIIDDNEYEKSEYFYVQLGEPILVEKDAEHVANCCRKFKKGSKLLNRLARAFDPEKPPSIEDMSNVDKDKIEQGEEVFETGKPRLGDIPRIKVIITESYEFKNSVDRFLKQGKWAIVIGTSSWQEQFVEAITVSAGGGDGKDDEEKLPSCMNYVMHFLTVFWKVLFAFVPPTDYGGGWFCFIVCITVIGGLTAVIGDVASSFGCSVGLTDAITATTFVALGTSLPDTFASKVAAISDQYADSSIGNVTGSNAVNVFLGIGIAWTIAAIYHAVNGTSFKVKTGSLGFSVTVFCIFAVVAIMLILLRRIKACGGELGGPPCAKWVSGLFFFTLWIVYIVLAGLENYCHIEGF